MSFLTNKKALITGIASNRSIAWGVAQAMHKQGAQLAFTYPNEKMKPRVQTLADQLGVKIVLPCDVAEDAQIQNLFKTLSQHWDTLDALVHSIAFAPREELEGLFLNAVTREGFNTAHEISSYSLAALARAAAPMMTQGKPTANSETTDNSETDNNSETDKNNEPGSTGAILTLTYIGSQRAMPGYNVMGLAKASLEANVRYLAQSLGNQNIRVNGISAGPIRTLAAAGIANFKKMTAHFEKVAPLGRAVTINEVGNTAAFLCSDLASGITGEITYVDAGFNTIGISEHFIHSD